MVSLSTNSIRWDITDKCNLKCIHCYNPPTVLPELRYGKIVEVLKILMSTGLQEVNLAGREPTLHPDLKKIIKWCRSQCLQVNLTTNGTVLSNDDFRLMLNRGINMIAFSLDGGVAKNHDRVRGNGAFFKTYRNIVCCLDHIYKKNFD